MKSILFNYFIFTRIYNRMDNVYSLPEITESCLQHATSRLLNDLHLINNKLHILARFQHDYIINNII